MKQLFTIDLKNYGDDSEPSRSMAELLLEEGVKKNPGPWRELS